MILGTDTIYKIRNLNINLNIILIDYILSNLLPIKIAVRSSNK